MMTNALKTAEILLPRAGVDLTKWAVVACDQFTAQPEYWREADAIAGDPDFGRIVCRCERVTMAEVLRAIRGPLGARSVNGVQMRTRAGMGRCQGGFCSPEVVRALSNELRIPMTEVLQAGEGSRVLSDEVCVEHGREN